MGSYIAIDIELEAIKNFLTKSLEIVDAEISKIFKKKEAGDFPGLDDFSNALFFPMQHEAISFKTMFYELNSLVEWELCNIASEAYSSSARHAKTPKFISDVPLGKLNRIKFVHDLPFGEVCRLIERYYEIKLATLPGAVEIQSVRHSVNAFKHRKGFKDFRRDGNAKLLEKFEPDRKSAFKAIEATKKFLRALRNEIKF